MALSVPINAGFLAVDTSAAKTITLPLSTDLVGRVLTIEDKTGNARINNITLQTQGGDTFQNAATTYKITQPFGSATFVSRNGVWLLQQGNEQIFASSIVTNILTVSSLNFSTIVDATFLTSTIAGLAVAGYISSTQLTSTVAGLGQAGYVSTSQLTSTVAGLYKDLITPSSLVSTVAGLGSIGYISSLSTITLSTGTLIGRTIAITDVNTNNQNLLTTSSGILLLNGQGIGSGGGAGSGMTVSDYVVAGRLNADQTLTADTDNTIQFIDDFDPQSWYNATTYFFTPTIAGYYLVSYQVWFSAPVTSNNQFNIQIQKNSADSYSITQLAQNTVTGTSLNATKIIYMNGSTDNLRFRAYVGNTSNTSVTAQQGNATGTGTFFTAALLTNGSSGSNLISTVGGLGTLGYVSTSQLVSTVAGLGMAGYVSSANLIGLVSTPNLLNLVSTANLIELVSTSFLNTSLVSTTVGLQTYISSFIDPIELASSISGLISTPNLSRLVSTPNLLNLVSTANLIGFVSTPNLLNLVSTQNLLGLVSTPNLLGLVSTTYLASQLASTVVGLSNVAVTQILAGSNITISPVGGVGAVTINGVAGGVSAIPANLSTSAFFTSSILASTINTRFISTGITTASTIALYDALNYNSANTVTVASTFFYFNSYILGGTRVAQQQWVVF